jgi:hypothetical protein
MSVHFLRDARCQAPGRAALCVGSSLLHWSQAALGRRENGLMPSASFLARGSYLFFEMALSRCRATSACSVSG